MVELFRLEDQRSKNIPIHPIGGSRRTNANHRVRFAIQAQLRANNVAVRTQTLPDPVGENDDVVFSGLPLFGQKITAHPGLFAKKLVVEARSLSTATDYFRRGTGHRQIEIRAGGTHQNLEGCILPLPVFKIAGGDPIPAALYLRPHHHKLPRIGIRHGLKQRGIDHAENRGGRANAQRERQCRDHREAIVLFPQAKSETYVAPEIHCHSPANCYSLNQSRVPNPSLVPQCHHGYTLARGADCPIYSIRKVSAGSIREIRTVGKKLATKAISSSPNDTDIIVSGSFDSTPYKLPCKTRTAKNAMLSPAIKPITLAITPERPTSAMTCRTSAPSAMRMPISRVLCTTRFDTKP